MRFKKLLLASALLVAALLVGQVGLLQGQQAGPKTFMVKLLLPEGENSFDVATKVFVDGEEVKGEGEVRTLTVKTAKDKDYVWIKAIWEPNNYTKITRPRKVVAKDGVVEVNFRKRIMVDPERDELDIRFYPTPQETVDAMCKLAKIGKDDVVYDLGCGDGRMVITAVQKFGAKKGIGVDLDPERIKDSKNAAKEAGPAVEAKLEFRLGDVLKVKDLSDATVILLYMGDDVDEMLKPILQKTLKPGSRVVSHRFLMGEDWPPDSTETVTGTNIGDCDIHLWVIKKQK